MAENNRSAPTRTTSRASSKTSTATPSGGDATAQAPLARTSNRTLGARGEHHACAYLSAQGYRVVATNWRCREGEIDIVALDGDEVVVIEVKTRRSSRFGPAIEAVTHEKHLRLRRLAALWMREHEVRASGVRLDVVGVEIDGSEIRIDHRRRVIL